MLFVEIGKAVSCDCLA